MSGELSEAQALEVAWTDGLAVVADSAANSQVVLSEGKTSNDLVRVLSERASKDLLGYRAPNIVRRVLGGSEEDGVKGSPVVMVKYDSKNHILLSIMDQLISVQSKHPKIGKDILERVNTIKTLNSQDEDTTRVLFDLLAQVIKLRRFASVTVVVDCTALSSAEKMVDGIISRMEKSGESLGEIEKYSSLMKPRMQRSRGMFGSFLKLLGAKTRSKLVLVTEFPMDFSSAALDGGLQQDHDYSLHDLRLQKKASEVN